MVVYTAKLINLQVGDTLQVLAEIQGVNHTAEPPFNHGVNVQLGTWVTLATSELRTVPLANESYICRPSGANIFSAGTNIGNHYGVPTRVGAVTIPVARTWHVNVIAYGLCDDDTFSENDHILTVPPHTAS